MWLIFKNPFEIHCKDSSLITNSVSNIFATPQELSVIYIKNLYAHLFPVEIIVFKQIIIIQINCLNAFFKTYLRIAFNHVFKTLHICYIP